ncbi:MAG: hypothetical protein KAV87_50360 [Desulfobacteraceae bacterium]|nr:hypothetical protein [Desulfobacteraceae bacterium]
MSKTKTIYFVAGEEYKLVVNKFGDTVAVPMENGPVAKLRGAMHGLLSAFDGRDPETDGRISLETTGVAVRAAQAALAEVE